MATWHELEGLHSHSHIKNNDRCIYAREYKSHKGFQGGRTNQLILNFKKPVSKKRTPEWKHRIDAVTVFRKEVEQVFKPDSRATITAVPNSILKTDPEYDNRFEDLFEELLKTRPLLNVEWPVEIKKTIPPARHGGPRNPEDIKKNYIWKGFNEKIIKRLCIFDDVLVKGAHFRAMSDFLRGNGYEGKIIGVFWSRAVYPSE